jgi:DNA polymerase elongation subunit (family B)
LFEGRAGNTGETPVPLSPAQEHGTPCLYSSPPKPQELIITRVLSQKVEAYKVDTPTSLAARQLENAGIHIQPGEKVRYVHREGKKGPKECRVVAAPFLETLDGYDTKIYLELLQRAIEEVMLALEEMVKE